MAPLTSKGKNWEIANSIWMIWSWVPMFGFISFLYIAMRVKQKKWFAWGAVYFIPWILVFVLPDATNPDGGWTDDLWTACVLLAWLGSAFHAFRVRKEYLLRRAAIEELKWRREQELKNLIELEYDVDLDKPLKKAGKEQAPTPPKAVEAQAKPINAPRQRVLNNEEAPALATRAATTETAPTASTASTSSISALTSTPDPVDSELVPEPVEEESLAASKQTPEPPAQPIDLNTATEAELASLPGVGEILAMRAVSEREVRGGFRSVEEFIKAIGLRPEVIERIRPYAFVTAKK